MANKSGNATILVMDPNPVSLTALAGVLDSKGYTCFCARSSEAATKAVQDSSIDLIIWDVADDAAATLDAIRQMRAGMTDQLSDVPFVLLADVQWSGLETRLDGISPARCLFKPLDPNALIDIVEQTLWVPHIVRGHHFPKSSTDQNGWVSL